MLGMQTQSLTYEKKGVNARAQHGSHHFREGSLSYILPHVLTGLLC